jgi:phosphoglycerate dehydrogenase-like enzyme
MDEPPKRSPAYTCGALALLHSGVMGNLTIWCNASLSEPATAMLSTGIGSHKLLLSGQRTGNLTAAGPDPLLAHADVAFGQPDPGQVTELLNLRWVHLSSAGYTRYDRPELFAAMRGRGAALTNSSHVFDEPCAQHLLAFMLAEARQLPASLINQAGPREWSTWQIRRNCRLLLGQSAVFLGFGAIPQRLVELLAPLHMNLSAVRRHPRGDEPIPAYPFDHLPRLLPTADHVINVLPDTPATVHLIGQSHFSAMKPGAVFYNIGRGATVDQAALLAALRSGKLGAAYLDVIDPEPPARDDPIWSAPNCWITPHTAGGHQDEHERVVRHFLENLGRFESGAPLSDRVL